MSKNKKVEGNLKDIDGEIEYSDCSYVGTQDSKDLFHGKFEIFRGGKLVAERTYVHGEITGKYVEYHTDGVIYTGNRLKGARHGEFKTIDPECGELDNEYYNMGTLVKTLEETVVPNEKSQKQKDLDDLRKEDSNVIPKDVVNDVPDLKNGVRTIGDIKKDIKPISEDEILNTATDLEKHIEKKPNTPAINYTSNNNLKALQLEYLNYVRVGDFNRSSALYDYFVIFHNNR